MNPCDVTPSHSYLYTSIPTMNTHFPTTQNHNFANSLRNEILRLPKFSDKCCIYRVPRHLQMENEGAYTPLVVSIGPLHHYEDHLRPTEIHKRKYLESFLNRSQCILEYYLEIIGVHEEDIRGYYADPMVAQMDREEFIKMVLVDAAFLIELFSRSHDPNLINADDQMFVRPRMVVEVNHDICLEENQLPFFILCKLYDASGFNQPERESFHVTTTSFTDIACQFLSIKSSTTRLSTEDPYRYKHLLDLLRSEYLPSEFRNRRLVDIKFNPDRGTLLIPRLVVKKETEVMFKNLIVFEQCHYSEDSYIIDYILFLGFLIKTPEDVTLLVREGIIMNRLNSNEMVVELFQSLTKNLTLRYEGFYYAALSKQLDDYGNHGWAMLLRALNHPWAKISVIYAVVILLLTVEQSVIAVISIMSKR